MSAFELKCPSCGIALVADENDIGAMASCAEFDYHFILLRGFYHNRSLRSLLFRLRLDSRLNLMGKGFTDSEEKMIFHLKP